LERSGVYSSEPDSRGELLAASAEDILPGENRRRFGAKRHYLSPVQPLVHVSVEKSCWREQKGIKMDICDHAVARE
jgi:hypothetical protein